MGQCLSKQSVGGTVFPGLKASLQRENQGQFLATDSKSYSKKVSISSTNILSGGIERRDPDEDINHLSSMSLKNGKVESRLVSSRNTSQHRHKPVNNEVTNNLVKYYSNSRIKIRNPIRNNDDIGNTDSTVNGIYSKKDNNSSTSTNKLSGGNIDKYWTQLMQSYRSFLMDPEDVVHILGMAIKKRINLLSPAEMTFLQRRVRKVIRTLERNVDVTKGRTGKKKMSMKENDYKSNNIYNKEGTLDENLMREIFIAGGRCLEQGWEDDLAERSLEEYKWRCDNMTHLNCEQLAKYNRCEQFEEREENNSINHIHIGTKDNEDIEDSYRNFSTDEYMNIIPYVRRKENKIDVKKNYERKDSNDTATSNISNKQVDRFDNIDPIGNAYTLLLHLSEPRFEYFAHLARLTAIKANITLDVNHKNQKDLANIDVPELPPMYPSQSIHYYSSDLKNDVNLEPPPIPNGISFKELSFLIATTLKANRRQKLILLFTLCIERKELQMVLESSPGGGVPTWLLEMKVDYNKEKRDNLNGQSHEEKHESKLDTSHGNHGVSSKSSKFFKTRKEKSVIIDGRNRIARETNGIYSLGSLSHYYYHGGVLPNDPLPNRNDKVKDNGIETWSCSQEIKVDAVKVINTLAVLLYYCDGMDSKRNGIEERDSPSIHKQPSKTTSFGNRNRTFSYGDTKYHSAKMHILVSQYRRQVKEGKDTIIGDSFNLDDEYGVERERRVGILDTFWSNSRKYFEQIVNPTRSNEGEKSAALQWNMQDFMLWANSALPCTNTALDTLLNEIFGMGVLPTPQMERHLVKRSWVEWQKRERIFYSHLDSENNDATETLALMKKSLKNFFLSGSNDKGDNKGINDCKFNNQYEEEMNESAVWGGIGGLDGRGGLGFGVMYCLEKQWWHKWMEYVGWRWDTTTLDNSVTPNVSINRPEDLSTEYLLNRDMATVVGGISGSYEVMKQNLKKNVDYILVPPGVWDLLYELYGGGPPIPRMVLPLDKKFCGSKGRAGLFSAMNSSAINKRSSSTDNNLNHSDEDLSIIENPTKVPSALNVVTHPWVLNCHVCDPSQPYRRGDNGLISIRVMASSDQPFWRVFAEIVVRLPVYDSRGKDSDGTGRARLWIKLNILSSQENKNSPGSRYGPWTLLCKNRFAIIPPGDGIKMEKKDYDLFQQNWESYAGNRTVNSVGLKNGIEIMFEYALLGKDGHHTWPREAAAKAGRLKLLADEDIVFRRMLRGIDKHDNLVENPPELVGKTVDAMDVSGRWYQAVVTQIEKRGDHKNEIEQGLRSSFFDNEKTHEEKLDCLIIDGEIIAVQVRFSDVGGHEWIDVNSDRLAVVGRFTLDSLKTFDKIPTDNTIPGNKDVDSKSRTFLKAFAESSPIDGTNNGGYCPYPGFGACGLTNLGNTCYVNSAVQCLSYMPFLRSYLVSGQYKICGDLNKSNPLGTGGKLLEEFAELLKIMWNGKQGIRAPSRFRLQLGRVRQQYSAADQQDAQELLNDMLDSLHEDSNKVQKKHFVEALEDDWVKNTNISRVGEEAWCRFIRRNRSIIVDVAMGQVLNQVTCPQCSHTSLNFDPFNMLSLPFPTNAEVIFCCKVIRRASATNCPNIFRLKNDRDNSEVRPERPSAPSNQLIIEEYAIPMSRLADVGDLKLQLQNMCGINSSRFKLCKTEEVALSPEIGTSCGIRHYVKVSILSDKEGPCVDLAKEPSSDKSSTLTYSPTNLIAFESTLNPRPSNKQLCKDKGTIRKSDDDSASQLENMKEYGDESECRLYDTIPISLAKEMSRSLWPTTASEFKLGLRVDAMDHRENWFPGSVVEIITGVDEEHSDYDKQTQVRIHFDNFSSKWDEKYSIAHFNQEHVQPLYSSAKPKSKPTEFIVHHRRSLKSMHGNALFGQPFFVQCHIEWSTIRAGAQILSQTARFLQPHPIMSKRKNNGLIDISDKERGLNKATDGVCTIIGKIIHLLIQADRKYVASALAVGKSPNGLQNGKKIDLELFDASALSSHLSKSLNILLPLLPFEIKICGADSPLGINNDTHEEAIFPFSLVRTIGNYMNARHAVVIHWRDPSKQTQYSSRINLLYLSPFVSSYYQNKSILNAHKERIKVNASNSNEIGRDNEGIHLGICLDEFCKEQVSESWRCSNCKEVRKGQQGMRLWNLPDLLTFHLKRFNCSARWKEKITTKVNFPLTGLNMKQWCDKDSSEDSYIYDLIGVVNHHGGMTGGHYVATCKATSCGSDGSEEMGHIFNGAGVHSFDADDGIAQPGGWRLGRSKEKESASIHAKTALHAAKSAAESSEPLWLQFDDDLVEAIPPKNVVSKMAYVLFYQRRRVSSSNIAKYSSMR